VANDEVHQVVVLPDGRRLNIAASPADSTAPATPATPAIDVGDDAAVGPRPGEPLGRYFGARSGDKGGNANVGIWATDAAGYRWLHEHLSTETVRGLIPEAADLEVHRYELPNLFALNFVIVGYLGQGVASSTAFDTQAKGLGEYLRSRVWPPT
jgi:hypothetical protein